MIEASVLRAIIELPEADLRSLASIAGGHPATFFRDANFDDTDLRGEDLRGFDLGAATFTRARVDRKTKVDRPFYNALGLQRQLVEINLGEPFARILKFSGVKLDRARDKHLGDLLEDATFGSVASLYLKFSKGPHWAIQFDKNALHKVIAPRRSPSFVEFEMVRNALALFEKAMGASPEQCVSDHIPALYRTTQVVGVPERVGKVPVLVLKRTADATSQLARNENMEIGDACLALLLAHFVALQTLSIDGRTYVGPRGSDGIPATASTTIQARLSVNKRKL